MKNYITMETGDISDDFSGSHWFMLFFWCRVAYNTTCSVLGRGSAVGHQSCWLVRAKGCVYVAVISNCAALTECIILIMRDYTHTHGDSLWWVQNTTGIQSFKIDSTRPVWVALLFVLFVFTYFLRNSWSFEVIQNLKTKRWTDQFCPWLQASCSSCSILVFVCLITMCTNQPCHTPAHLEI